MPNNQEHSNHIRKGSFLVEGGVSMTIWAGILALAVVLIGAATDMVSAFTSGLRAGRFSTSVANHVEKNWDSLLTASAAGPIMIEVNDLVTSGSWDSIETEGTAPNLSAYVQTRQSLKAIFQQISSTQARVAIVTNGTAFSESQASMAAWAIALNNGNGGVISNSATECAPSAAPCALGLNSTYSVALSVFDDTPTNASIPGENHIVSMLFFGDGQLIKPYLYRFDCGNDECRTMYQDLDMNGNTIDGVYDIYLESRGVYLSQVVQTVYIVSHNQVIEKPTCPTNAPNPRIYLAQQIWSDSGASLPVASAQFRASDEVTQWRVSIDVLTQAGWTNPPDATGKAMAIVSCDA